MPDQHEVFRGGNFVTKPSDTSTLVSLIRSLLDSRAGRETG